MFEPTTLTFRCDDAAGFEFRVLRSGDGDFHLAVVPCCEDMSKEEAEKVYSGCFAASVRVRAPMLGGGSHEKLWHALTGLFKVDPKLPPLPSTEDVVRAMREFAQTITTYEALWSELGDLVDLTMPDDIAATIKMRLREISTPTKVDQAPNGCWAACIATITGIPLAELDQGIPADASDDWMNAHETELHNDMIKRLRERGWRLDYVGKDIPRGYSIASGKSPRRAGVWHAVVAKDGALWHDPHHSRAGLAEEAECYEVLIPLVGSGYK